MPFPKGPAASVPMSGFPMAKKATATIGVPHGTGRPFLGSTPVALAPPTGPAAVVDAMIEDAAVMGELRARFGGKPYQERRGHRWIARRDGACNKTVGWFIDDAGRLLTRECGAPILKGTECWRQDGHLYYGQGCHKKGILAMPREFAGRFVNESEFANNLPDRRIWLERACRLWDVEVEADQLRGEWGTDERRASERMICDSIITALKVLQSGKALPLKPPADPKVLTRKEKAAVKRRAEALKLATPIVIQPHKPQSKTMQKDKVKEIVFAPPAQRDPAAPQEVLGVLKRFAGPNAVTLAQGWALQQNEARGKQRTQYITMREGSQVVVVDPKMARLEAQRRKLPLPPYAEPEPETIVTPLDPTGKAGTNKLDEAIKTALKESKPKRRTKLADLPV